MFFKFRNLIDSVRGNATPPDLDWDGVPVTPADATPLPSGISRGVACIGTGNITGVLACGAGVVITGAPANTVMEIALAQIGATGTTATGIYALY